MKRTFKQKFILGGIISAFILSSVFFQIPKAHADTRSDLENQLKEIELQISQYEKDLSTTKTQKNTLTNKIASLKKTQASLKLQIKKTALVIDDLVNKIDDTQKQISDARDKITILKDDLATMIQMIDQKDQASMIEILTTQDFLSEWYNQVHSYTVFSNTVRTLVDQIKNSQNVLAKKQDVLSGQRDDAKNLLSVKTLQQQALIGTITEQADLLTQTKGKESTYQQMLSDSKKQAAEIQNRIYTLLGGGQKINFGQAVDIANVIAKQTGIRPAFLLAILTQESNLGSNVGTCNRAGDPPEKSWKVIMKPTRDQEPFKTITSELNKDIDTTPVSCPMKNKDGSQLGWGGAMGPAQFIPSTWMGYRDKITAITGVPANPWDNRDAFLAAALKLTADGADGTDNGDWRAAMMYFSGSTNTKYRFYGDNVLKTTNKYLSDIAELGK